MKTIAVSDNYNDSDTKKGDFPCLVFNDKFMIL